MAEKKTTLAPKAKPKAEHTGKMTVDKNGKKNGPAQKPPKQTFASVEEPKPYVRVPKAGFTMNPMQRYKNGGKRKKK